MAAAAGDDASFCGGFASCFCANKSAAPPLSEHVKNAAKYGCDWKNASRAEPAPDASSMRATRRCVVVGDVVDPIHDEPARVGRKPTIGRWL